MKLTIAAFFLGLLSLTAASTYSQNTKITLDLEHATLFDVFKQIEAHTEFVFIYKNAAINLDKKVDVKIEGVTVDKILDQILQDFGVKYEIIDKQIIITPDHSISQRNEGIIINEAASQPQKKAISGSVKDLKGLPIPGVSVVVKGTTIGTVTDNDGNYRLTVPTDAKTLVFSFVGMQSQEVAIGNKSTLSVDLQEETFGLNEVVTVGYGTQRKVSLTAAVSSINANELASIPTDQLSNVLQGRLSGTYIQAIAGTPGVPANIRIRSQSSWNGGDAVYVIDGVVRDVTVFNALDPNEVEDITVLKDAASAAIYGSRSSNGVILVNTKKGKTGKMQIKFSVTGAAGQIAYLPPYMSTASSIKLDEFVDGNTYPSAQEAAYILKVNPKGNMWFDAAYSTPTHQNYSMSISGGSDKVTYYIGGSIYDEKGWLPQVGYQKYNLRGSTTIKVTNNLTVGMTLDTNNGDRTRFSSPYPDSQTINNMWIQTQYFGGNVPPYINGKPVNPGWINVVDLMKNGGTWEQQNNYIDALVNLEYKVPQVPGLSAKVAYSRNINNSDIKDYEQTTTLYNFKTEGANSLIYTDTITGTSPNPGQPRQYVGYQHSKMDSYQLNGQINYEHQFGKHHISAMVAYEQYEAFTNSLSAYRYDFPLIATPQFFAASANSKDWTNSAGETQDGRLSYIGRVNYDYADKYLFSASVREDGSIKFAPDKRWGSFPSLAAGWRISEEHFFKQSKVYKVIDMLKLRASFGATGNDAIGGWQWQEQYNISGGYYMGNPGSVNPGLTYGGIVNPNITWEKSNSYNYGLDMSLLHKITLTTEFWFRHTYDILGPRVLALPTEFGGTMPAENYGIMNSHGFEVELQYNTKLGKDFHLFVKGNFNYATNKVIQEDVAANTQEVNNPNGKTLGYLTGLQTTGTGLFRTQADLAKLPEGFTEFGQAPVLGMLAFKDVSGPHGVPDGVVDSYDMVKLANYGINNAPFSYGLNLGLEWKGIRMDMQFAGLAGFKTFYNDPFGKGFGYWYWNHPSFWENAYTPSNIHGTAPQPFNWGDPRAVYEQANNSYMMYNGSFVRLKNLNIGYDLPGQSMNKLGISGVRVFVSGTNLLLFTKFKFWDPELPSMQNYPLTKTYSLGINVNF